MIVRGNKVVMPAVEESVVLEGRDGFPAAYAAHHDWAVRVAYLLCGDRAVAEDVVADAWLGIYERLGGGPIADVRPYLCRSVVNGAQQNRRLLLSRREAARPSATPPPLCRSGLERATAAGSRPR